MYSGDNYDENLFNETITSIKRIRAKIIKKSKFEGRKLLLYVIDTLFEIIAENNKTKIFDFADTIHNIPEIPLGMRNIYSFDEEILTFQKKYGKKYFPDFKQIKPKFQKKAPKNAWEFFSPESDESFKYLHPIGYKVLCVIGALVLVVPMFIYLAYIIAINPAPNEWTIIIGVIGAFIIGIGFFNIVAAWIHQYLGHLVTIICLLLGSALTVFSLYSLYR